METERETSTTEKSITSRELIATQSRPLASLFIPQPNIGSEPRDQEVANTKTIVAKNDVAEPKKPNTMIVVGFIIFLILIL